MKPENFEYLCSENGLEKMQGKLNASDREIMEDLNGVEGER